MVREPGVTVEQSPPRRSDACGWPATALLVLGLVMVASGGLAWAFDVDPSAGKLLLVGGVAAVGVGWLARTRLTPLLARVLVVVLVVLAVVAVVVGAHLLQLFVEQHRAHAA